MSSKFSQWIKVIIVPYIVCCLLLALFFGLICLRGGYGVEPFVLAWLSAHLGPLHPFIVGLLSGTEVTFLGLLAGIAFSGLVGAGAIAYLIHPKQWTRRLTIISICLWFFCGFISIIMGIT